MRLARPPSEDARNLLFISPTTVSFMLGWATLLAGARDLVTVETKSLGRCPHCQTNMIRLPDGIQGSLVGKECIKESHMLRELEIQEPWTFDQACQFGPDGALAWQQEKDSPPLDEAPQLKTRDQALLEQLADAIPTPETPFNQHTWDRVSEAGDQLISSTGSLITAAHAFVSHWGKTRKATTLTPSGMKVFENLVKPDIYDVGLELATYGVKARSHATPTRFRQPPYPSVRDEPIQTMEHLRPELLEGGTFLVFGKKARSSPSNSWRLV